MLTLLFDGVAYGMLLFVLAVGLSITLGLMNFINLAHGSFAMVGGYAMVMLSKQMQIPFLICLPIVFVVVALLGALLESTLYRRMYKKNAFGSGAVLHRLGVHVSGGHGFFHGIFSTKYGFAALAARPR